MADTFVKSKDSVFGDMRVIMGVLTDGGGAVATGLDWIYNVSANITSGSTAGYVPVYFNTAASGAGDIAVGSGAAGDTVAVTIFGK